MTIFRKSRIITLVFSATWLIMSLSYAIGAECMCCNPHKIQGKCNQITHNGESCLDIKCIFKDCQCYCISYDKSSHQDVLSQKEHNKLGGNQPSLFKQGVSDNDTSIIEGKIVRYQHNKFLRKYLSILLIKSSFLL